MAQKRRGSITVKAGQVIADSEIEFLFENYEAGAEIITDKVFFVDVPEASW